MGSIKRNIKKHYSISSKELAIQSKTPWYLQLVIAVIIFVLGFVLAAWRFNQHNIDIDELKMSKQSLEVQIIKFERQLQIERVAQEKLQTELNEIQESHLKTKEELVFYKNMLDKRKGKKR